MMRFSLFLAGSALLLAIPSQAAGPVVVYFTGDRSEVSTILASRCVDRGIMVVSQTESEVLCQQEVSGFKGVLAQMLVGNAYSTRPQVIVRFAILRGSHYTIVQGSQWLETQMAMGQIRREPFDSKKNVQELTNSLISIGGLTSPPLAAPKVESAPAAQPVQAAEETRQPVEQPQQPPRKSAVRCDTCRPQR